MGSEDRAPTQVEQSRDAVTVLLTLPWGWFRWAGVGKRNQRRQCLA